VFKIVVGDFEGLCPAHATCEEKDSMTGKRPLLIAILALAVLSPARAICPYDANCINNPITGRNPVAPQGGAVVAPFSRYSSTNRFNPEFNGNPGVINPISNPYAPALKTTGDSGTLASPLSSGLGGGLGGSNSGLQGVDPDLRR
jgi:hypothetical protein